jgi:putative aldouronate transport system permease protein
MAAVIIAVVPILIVYPFIQRHFTKGIMIGSIKG